MISGLGIQGLGDLPPAAVLALLSKVFDQGSVWDNTDVGIKYEGREITLPDDPERMTIIKAIEALQRLQKDQEQAFQVREVIDAFPHDGAVAFVKAMTKLYGFASPQTIHTMFGKRPPQMLSIKTGPAIEDVIQVPMGRFALPGVDNPIDTGMGPLGPNGQYVYFVQGEVKKKDKFRVLEIVNLARKIVREESIYRGKPLRFAVDDDGQIDMSSPPEFMDVSDMMPESLIFDNEVRDQIETSIMTPIKRMRECILANIPMKRTCLLEGPFGTGKSLTAKLTARVAEEHGWTFILLDKVKGLRVALEFANRYAPAVVFAEDIDRIAQVRDDDTNDLINTIDGVVSKSSKIMTILTTNFVEKLNRSILRPGRLDAIISVRAPGPETVGRLIQYYAGTLLEQNADLSDVGEVLTGQIPASIREAVERAKLSMIGRGGKQLNGHDLAIAARTMKNHLDLLNGAGEPILSAGDRLAEALRATVNIDDKKLDQARGLINDNTDYEANETQGVVRSTHSDAMLEIEGLGEHLKAIRRKVGA